MAAKYFKGLVVGGLVGAVLGILYAPKSGKETRQDISTSKDEMLEKARMQYEDACKRMDEFAARKKEMYAEKKERLKRAIDAGAEAMKEEKKYDA